MRGPGLTIITPWRDHRDLWPAYERAVSFRQPNDEVLIIDNGSQPPLTFANVRFPENRGFHAANNHGLALTDTAAVLFLNNDIEITRSDWLETIRDSLAHNSLVGASLNYDRHADVDGQQMPYLGGWCIAGWTDELLAIGGWDETLAEPAYYGDNLLCLRARQAGMTLRGVSVGLRHFENTTSSDDIAGRERASAANRRVYQQAVREALVAA